MPATPSPNLTTATIPELKAWIKSLQAELKILELREAALHAHIQSAKDRLVSICDHPKVKEESTYYGGNFDTMSSTKYRLRCVTCDHVTKHWQKSNGYYG